MSTACGEAAENADAAAAGDASLPRDGASDAAAGPRLDAGLDPDGSVPATCEAACRDNALEARFGGTTRAFEQGFYGLTVGALATTVHLEVLGGSDGSCPTEASPTPERTLVIAGLSLPAADGRSTVDGVSLLDFEGALLPGAPVSQATTFEVGIVALDVCPACVGEVSPSHPEGFVALDVSATFTDGEVTGHAFAVHCDSMDVAP